MNEWMNMRQQFMNKIIPDGFFVMNEWINEHHTSLY